MELRLDGRLAVITGGSKGLGYATAERFLASGAEVALLARTPGPLEEAADKLGGVGNGRITAHICDVADPKAVQSAYDEIMAVFGRIDILVNNAGETRAGPIEAVDDDMWMNDIDQKLLSVPRFVRLVWPQMRERRWGRIINVLSIGSRAQNAGHAPTAVTRAAGLALTNILSKEGAPHNILVNAILVGKIVTDQIVRAGQAETGGKTVEDLIAATAKSIPIGRMGEASEFANVACFLASDASSYVAGTAIAVDGGLSPVI